MNEIDRPNQEELLSSAVVVLNVAQAFVVNSEATYKLAAEELIEVKTAIKELTERRMERTRKLDELKKLIMADYAPALGKLDEAKSFYERGMLTFTTEQERLRRAEAARLEAIARAERERLENEAKKLDKKGQAEEAEEARLTAQVIVAAPVQSVAPTATGTTIRKTWKAKVINFSDLVKFVAAHPEYLNLLEVSESSLNQLARAQKQNMKIDGVEAYEESSITSRQHANHY